MKQRWPGSSWTRVIAVAWLAAWYGGGILAQTLPIARDTDFHLARNLATPSWRHPFGADAFGRDLLWAVVRGSLNSSLIAALATASALIAGVTIGSVLAAGPRAIRAPGVLALETCLAFPYLLFALALAAVRGPGWGTLFVALSLGAVPYLARLILARGREVMTEAFVHAAISQGAGSFRITRVHVLPHVLSLALVKAPLLLTQALLAEAALSFLGIGAPAGAESWGALIAQGKDYLIEAPHVALATGTPLVLTVLALQRLVVTGIDHGGNQGGRW